MANLEPTIAREVTAVAAITPIGPAGIAVIRVAGPDARRIAKQVFEPMVRGSKGGPIAPGRVVYGRIVDNGQVIDDVVLTVRPLTGEPEGSSSEIVEINAHGGIRVVQRILMLLVRQGARLADPEEIGLLGWPATSAIEREARSSLTRAQTHRAAMWLANQQTLLPAMLRRWITRLDTREQIEVTAVTDELKDLLSRYEPARRLVDGAGIVIAGPPNAGKSTLANRLFGQPRSLVTEQPGTTRDWVAEPAAVEGVPIVLVDTAGLRVAEDPIEQASIERGLGRAASADLVLLVLDRSEEIGPSSRYAIDAIVGIRPADRTLLVLNKCDLPDRLGEARELDVGWAARVVISAATGEGSKRLGHAVVEALGLAGWSDQTAAVWTPAQQAGIRTALARLPSRPAEAAAALHEIVEI